MTESATLAEIRLEAARLGGALWRNNNGAAKDDTGRMIRYGLGNDSHKLSRVWTSADLIGIVPVLIQPEHVGKIAGIFWAVECKEPGWRGAPAPGNDREQAQAAFLQTVRQYGGIGYFARSGAEMKDKLKWP